MVEFTVPWEERTEECHDSKKDLVDSWRESCWKTAVFLVVFAVGCPSQSVLRMLGTSADENERQAHVLEKLHTEHPVWLWLRPSERTNSKPTYVDEVVIGQHYLPCHPEDVSSMRGRNIWWRMETELIVSTFSSDIYKTIHVIVLQT